MEEAKVGKEGENMDLGNLTNGRLRSELKKASGRSFATIARRQFSCVAFLAELRFLVYNLCHQSL